MLAQIIAQEGDSGGGSIIGLLPLLALPLVFYFLLIRPQRRRMREQQALVSSIEEGDEVMTTSGMYGFVTAIEGDVVWLEIAEGIDIRVARAALSRKVLEGESAPAEPDADTADAGDATDSPDT
jgi:preprotein translocase subunit YajC